MHVTFNKNVCRHRENRMEPFGIVILGVLNVQMHHETIPEAAQHLRKPT